MPNYAHLASPLTYLLKKEGFHWSTIEEQSFDILKKSSNLYPILVLPNFTTPFLVEIDACEIGLGVVLHQQER